MLALALPLAFLVLLLDLLLLFLGEGLRLSLRHDDAFGTFSRRRRSGKERCERDRAEQACERGE